MNVSAIFRAAWTDSVWSKVIATGVTAVLTAAFGALAVYWDALKAATEAERAAKEADLRELTASITIASGFGRNATRSPAAQKLRTSVQSNTSSNRPRPGHDSTRGAYRPLTPPSFWLGLFSASI
jgi:hypothetical protein